MIAAVIEPLWQDFRYALRFFRTSPGFSIIAVLTLGLGVAVNATIFSVVGAVLLRPLALPDPDSLVVISATNRADRVHTGALTAADCLDLQRINAFQDIAIAMTPSAAAIIAPGISARVSVERVSANYFQVLGAGAEVGRVFAKGEDAPGRSDVVILSQELWVRDFGASPQAVGRTVSLGGVPAVIIGVMPASAGRSSLFAAQLWAPLNGVRRMDRSGAREFYPVARLASGAKLEQARSAVAVEAARWTTERPENHRGWSAGVMRLQQFRIDDANIRPAMTIMMTAVEFVLLIACVNLGNLLLVRATSRRQEIAVRSALGAPRARLLRQLLTECLVLALGGGLLGLLLSSEGIRLVRNALSFNDYVRSIEPELDWRVFSFVIAISVLTVLLFGLLPALKTVGVKASAALRAGARAGSADARTARLRNALVIGEISLAIVLLTGAALMIESLRGVLSSNPGVDPKRILTGAVTLAGPRYPRAEQKVEALDQFLEGLRRLPQVRRAALTSNLPGTGAPRVDFRLDPTRGDPRQRTMRARHYVISPGFLASMNVALLSGRDFAGTDRAESPPVILVNKAFLDAYLSGKDPLGRLVYLKDSESAPVAQPRMIVGVVGRMNDYFGQTTNEPQIFETYSQSPRGETVLVVETFGNAAGLAPEVRRALRAVDPDEPISGLATLHHVLEEMEAGDRLFDAILSLFAALALLLAVIGAYGVVSLNMAQRTAEFGIRIALGASKYQVMVEIWKEALRIAGAGVAIGSALSLSLPSLLGAAFEGFTVSSSLAFLAVPGIVLLVCVLASIAPAFRASRLDPVTALRNN